MTTRTLTGNRGASETRAEIKKFIGTVKRKRIKNTQEYLHPFVVGLCSEIVDFIDGMAPRANAKPGGLGRKWTARKKGSKTNRAGQK